MRQVLPALLAGLLACAVAELVPLADLKILDFLFLLRGPRKPQAPIVIVSVDLPAAKSAGRQAAGAARLARIVRAVASAHPRAVVIGYTPLVRLPEDAPGIPDLARAIAGCGRVVLPACLARPGETIPRADAVQLSRFACGQGQLMRPVSLASAKMAYPPSQLVRAAAGLGTTNLYPDIDSVVRTFPLMVSYDGALYPSLPLEAVRVALGLGPGAAQLKDGRIVLGKLQVPVEHGSAEAWLNWAGGHLSFPVLSARTVLEADTAWRAWALGGRIVIIGPTAVGTAPIYPAPLGPAVTGVEVVATAVENVWSGLALRRVSRRISCLLALLAALLAWILTWRGALWAAASNALLLLAVLGALCLALCYGIFVPGTAILLSVVFSAAGNLIQHSLQSERRRAEAEARFQSRLQALERIGELIGSALDRRQLLRAIMNWVAAELEVEACSLMLLDRERDVLKFEIALGPKGHEILDFTVPVGHGIAGWVAMTGQSVIVNDVARDPHHAREIAKAVDFYPRNILCVPMRLRGEVVGVLEALNKTEGRDFVEEDEYLLTAIAQQAALLLENERLYRQLQERVDFANAELREAYRRLEERKAEIETLIAQTASIVIATDEEGKIVLFNRAAEEALGVPATRAVGHDVFSVVPEPAILALFAEQLEDADDGHVVREVELRDGRPRIFRASLALVRGPSGEIVGKSLVMTDITELKELDRLKTDLISFVAHELRNPISVISGMAALALRRLGRGEAESARGLMEHIDKAARRMERLVESFLNLSRLEAGKPLEFNIEPIDAARLKEMIEQTIAIEPRATAQHRFEVQVPDDLPPVLADAEKLECVLGNLIGNAVKYSPDGGLVAVRVRRQDGELLFEVSDEGIGIAPEELPHIFEKFRRARQAGAGAISGAGVGLYLTKRLLEGMGGRIWIESEQGKGTTAYFTLPLAGGDGDEGQGGAG